MFSLPSDGGPYTGLASMCNFEHNKQLLEPFLPIVVEDDFGMPKLRALRWQARDGDERFRHCILNNIAHDCAARVLRQSGGFLSLLT